MKVFELILSCYGGDNTLCISADMQDLERIYDEHHVEFRTNLERGHETVRHGWIIYVWEGGCSSASCQYENRHRLVEQERVADGGDERVGDASVQKP